jgi:hypothetical protein
LDYQPGLLFCHLIILVSGVINNFPLIGVESDGLFFGLVYTHEVL